MVFFIFSVPILYPETTPDRAHEGENSKGMLYNLPPLRVSRELGSLYSLVTLFSLQVSCDLHLQPQSLNTEHLVPLYLRR